MGVCIGISFNQFLVKVVKGVLQVTCEQNIFKVLLLAHATRKPTISVLLYGIT